MSPVEITISRPSDEYVDSNDAIPVLNRPDRPIAPSRPQSSGSSEQGSTAGAENEDHEQARPTGSLLSESEISHEGSERGDEESLLLTKLQQQNARLRAERDKAILDRDDYKNKHDTLLAERSNLKRRRLWASTAKVQRAFLELASRVDAWCDEISSVAANYGTQNIVEDRAVSIPFRKAKKSILPVAPSSIQVGYVTRIVWQELVNRAFPSESTIFDKNTDLWVDEKDGAWIGDTVERMESKGMDLRSKPNLYTDRSLIVSADDLRLWVCMTAVAMRPGPDQYNRRLVKIMERVCVKVNTYLGLSQDHSSPRILDQDDSVVKQDSKMAMPAVTAPETELNPALLSLKAKLMFEILPKVAEFSWMLRRCPLRTCLRWPPKLDHEGIPDFQTSPVVISPELVAFEHVAGAEQYKILVALQTLDTDAEVKTGIQEKPGELRRLNNIKASIKSVFGR